MSEYIVVKPRIYDLFVIDFIECNFLFLNEDIEKLIMPWIDLEKIFDELSTYLKENIYRVIVFLGGDMYTYSVVGMLALYVNDDLEINETQWLNEITFEKYEEFVKKVGLRVGVKKEFDKETTFMEMLNMIKKNKGLTVEVIKDDKVEAYIMDVGDINDVYTFLYGIDI